MSLACLYVPNGVGWIALDDLRFSCGQVLGPHSVLGVWTNAIFDLRLRTHISRFANILGSSRPLVAGVLIVLKPEAELPTVPYILLVYSARCLLALLVMIEITTVTLDGVE